MTYFIVIFALHSPNHGKQENTPRLHPVLVHYYKNMFYTNRNSASVAITSPLALDKDNWVFCLSWMSRCECFGCFSQFIDERRLSGRRTSARGQVYSFQILKVFFCLESCGWGEHKMFLVCCVLLIWTEVLYRAASAVMEQQSWGVWWRGAGLYEGVGLGWVGG